MPVSGKPWLYALVVFVCSGFTWNVGQADPPEGRAAEVGIYNISADSVHTCALDQAGQAYCWGFGGRGRLGNGMTVPQSTPVRVDQGDLRFVTITTGLSHSCAIAEGGAAYCWGNGASGRLGTGSITSSSSPVPVTGDHEFVQITAGRQFTCGLDKAGAAYCWGQNMNGQLGVGTKGNSSSPIPVTGDHLFTTITAGGYHACGIKKDGSAYCWGSQNWGKLGNGETKGSSLEPVPVRGNHKFASIDATRQHTCAVTVDGEAYCWGSQANGKLGNGKTKGKTGVKYPTPVQTDLRFVSVTAGSQHSCGLTREGKGYCWGSNGRGKSGVGYIGRTSATPRQIVDVENFVSLTAGLDHSCGVTSDGAVYCWGNAKSNRLGTGSDMNSGTPLLVEGIAARVAQRQ